MEKYRKTTGSLFFWIIISGVVLISIYRRLGGIAPNSLWLDDVWCAALAKYGSVPFILTGKFPAPPGFILMLKAMGKLFGFSAFWLQMLPLFASVSQIFLIAYIVRKITKMDSLAVSAAIILAGNPTLASYSLRIKPFALDGLIVLVILALSLLSLEYKEKKYFILLSLFSAAAVFISFTSIFLSTFAVLLVHYRLFLSFENNKLKKIIAGSAAVYFLIVLILVAFFIKGRCNPSFYLYWKDFYIPIKGLKNIAVFLNDKGLILFKGAFFKNIQWMAIFIPLGIWRLICDKENRPIGYTVALFYIAIFMASALKNYPIGGGRTDIFTYPISVLAATAGVWHITRAIKIIPVLLLITILVFYLNDVRDKISYPINSSRAVVELLHQHEKDGDTLIIFPWANWAVGYYSKWKPVFVNVDDSTNGFYMGVDRPNTYVLRETYKGIDFRLSPQVMSSQLKFLETNPKRVIYLATNILVARAPHQWIIKTIIAQGYSIEYYGKCDDGCLIVFSKQRSRLSLRRTSYGIFVKWANYHQLMV